MDGTDISSSMQTIVNMMNPMYSWPTTRPTCTTMRNAAQARDRLGMLEQSDGRAGFGQRLAKGKMQNATRFPEQKRGDAAGEPSLYYDEQDLADSTSKLAGAAGNSDRSGRRGPLVVAGPRRRGGQLGHQFQPRRSAGGEATKRLADCGFAVQRIGRIDRQQDRWVDADLTKEQERSALLIYVARSISS